MLNCAETVWKSLNGMICVYKPSKVSCEYVKHSLVENLCNGLNNLQTRPDNKYVERTETHGEISFTLRPSYADNVLCVGPRYQPEDFDIYFPSHIAKLASGVLGINNGRRVAQAFRNSTSSKCYQVKGILGQATENFYIDEKVIARAKYDHVTKASIDKLLASYQAAYQKRIFQEYRVDPRSQEAYDLAVSGLLRPRQKKTTILYGLKCVDFQPPEFTVEVNCVFEDQATLLNLIHNLGVSLKCYATCTGLRCIKYGCFTVEQAMVKRLWNLENVLQNMSLCLERFEKFYPKNTRNVPFIKPASL